MDENRRRSPRTPVGEPTTIAAGDATYDATLKDISDGGAAIEFTFERLAHPVRFDIGSRVTLEPGGTGERPGRVIREYEDGFAMAFEAKDANETNKE